MDWLLTAASTVVALFVGGLITYLTTRSQLRIEARHEYDVALRDLRIPHYMRLFALTAGVPREWRDEPDKTTLLELRERMHEWFFGEEAGGMFLSQAARLAYFELQNALQSVAASLPKEGDKVGDEGSERLRGAGSALRHQLAADLGLAEQPRQRWAVPRSVPPPPLRGQTSSRSRRL